MKTITKLGYFLFGMGAVNVAAYPYLKDYQVVNQRELDQLMAEHEKTVMTELKKA